MPGSMPVRFGILAVVPLALAARPAAAGSADTGTVAVSEIRYQVTYDAAAASRGILRVSMSFRASAAGIVLLSLPAWSPGSYELDHFARHVWNFSAEADGEPIRWDKADWDTWRLHAAGPGTVTVRLEYRADTLDTGMSWSAADFAFFNGTNLFLYPEGQGFGFPARVNIRTDDGWLIATGMTPAGETGEYRASNYHELVDMPTFIGRFDLDSAQVEGRWFRLGTYPAGALAGEARERTWDHVRRMLPPMSAVFGETPWERYTILMAFPPGFGGASALEHANSHLGLYAPHLAGHPIVSLVTAHEIFHAWNVKRLRPHELVPYRYDEPQPTTLLWVSEGITDYYADLAMTRGGIGGPPAFYQAIERKLGEVRAAPPVALEDASLSTWIEPTDGTAFLYYPKGSLAGLMLDILVRDASDNRASLDDVLRELYRTTYKLRRGFTEGQFWQAVQQAAGRSFAEFHARYVDGRDPYPWDEVLPLAGLALRADTIRTPRIGLATDRDAEGVRVVEVVPGSAADAAGVTVGDLLLRVGDVAVGEHDFGLAFRGRYGGEPEGTPYRIVVRRGEQTLELEADLRFAEDLRLSVVEDPAAPPKAVRIRRGILEGTTGS